MFSYIFLYLILFPFFNNYNLFHCVNWSSALTTYSKTMFSGLECLYFQGSALIVPKSWMKMKFTHLYACVCVCFSQNSCRKEHAFSHKAASVREGPSLTIISTHYQPDDCSSNGEILDLLLIPPHLCLYICMCVYVWVCVRLQHCYVYCMWVYMSVFWIVKIHL